MNSIIFISLATFTLAGGVPSNSISVEFTVRDCTSNCLSAITNPVGKVRLYGISEVYHVKDMERGTVIWTELSEQTFTTTTVPFTLNIEYPDDIKSIIEADYEAIRASEYAYGVANSELPEDGMPEDSLKYEVEIVWDADANSVSNCGGDIQVDGYWQRGDVDLTESETQTVYIKKAEDTGTCEGEILLKFTTKDCDATGNCVFNNVKGGFGKISLYAYDSTNNINNDAALIHQQDFELESNMFSPAQGPIKLPVPYPQNPWSLIENLGNKKDAKYYVELDYCGLQIVKENEQYQNIDLEVVQDHVNRYQTVYIQEYQPEDQCDSACHYETFVKVLLPFFFVFYMFI